LDYTILWLSGNQEIEYASGAAPSIAISQDGLIVEVHSAELSHSVLLYRIGEIQSDYIIKWLTGRDSIPYDAGLTPAITQGHNGLVVETHSSAEGILFYRLGQIQHKWAQIEWISGEKAVPFGSGSRPSVATIAKDRVLEVDSSANDLNYRIGEIQYNKIFWSMPKFYDNGNFPAVSANKDGAIVEVHTTLHHEGWLASRFGRYHANEIFWQSESNYFEYGTDPAVSCNSRFAIHTHSPAGFETLHFSACLITDRARWMEERLPSLGKRKLRDLVLPASHDAGMYVDGVVATLGKTQDLRIEKQLEYGIRYFDLRPSWTSGNLYIHHGPITGPLLQDVLNGVAQFMKRGHRELVILKFSHYSGFDDSIYNTLLGQIETTLKDWLYMGNREPRKTPLEEFVVAKGVILVVCDESYPMRNPKRGIWVYRDWDSNDPENGDLRVYDKYSSTTSFPTMQVDQFHKFREYNGYCLHGSRIPCDQFLLSWTITPTTGVWAYSRRANRRLASGIAEMQIPNREFLIVNLLYVDFVEYSRVTDIAIFLNELSF
jgi:hypothetical protein